jgi:hypothetical protein
LAFLEEQQRREKMTARLFAISRCLPCSDYRYDVSHLFNSAGVSSLQFVAVST